MQLRGQSFSLSLLLPSLVATFITLASGQLTLEEIAKRYTVLTPGGGIHVPILPWERSNVDGNLKRAPVSTVGIGDLYDVIYSALVTIGETVTPLLVDTGSSDLWVISDTCLQGCNSTAKPYPQAMLRSANLSLVLRYGDSRTGTFASGLVGFDTVGLGTVAITNQSFAAMNRTNTTLPRAGVAGILGIGFPINSLITSRLFRLAVNTSTLEQQNNNRNLAYDLLSGSYDSRRQTFPSNTEILGIPSTESRHVTRQSISPSLVQALLASWSTLGPFVPRLISEKALPEPQVAVTLQRNIMDIGGNLGMLSIGELPVGVKTTDLTWVALRGYSTAFGGIPAPVDSPSEVYPITWEVMIDNVYLDGERLPMPTSTPPSIGLSALVDTGNSLLRGPEDSVSLIRRRLGPSGSFSCAEPHNISFEIGGKIFPVDPRDFARQSLDGNTEICVPALAATDAPRMGGYLFSWSLGVPFLKGVLSSYYFGNITYPSQDPPKMGFLSTVPSDAGDLMRAAAAAAGRAGDFPAIIQAAPSVVPKPAATDSHGVPQAKATANRPTNNPPNDSSDSTLRSGESCQRLCSAMPHLSLAAFFSLIIAGWNIGLR